MTSVTQGRLFRLNCFILLGSAAVGAVVAVALEVRYPIDPPGSGSNFQGDVAAILTANLGVFGLLALGILTFGVFTIAVLGYNGLRVGFDVTALLLTSPREIGYAAPYIFIEFAAFCQAAAGSEALGLALFELLFKNRVSKAATGAGWSIACSLILISSAAAIEAAMRSLRDKGGLP